MPIVLHDLSLFFTLVAKFVKPTNGGFIERRSTTQKLMSWLSGDVLALQWLLV